MASEYGVYIPYYRCDSESGGVALTETVYDALAYTIFQERVQQEMTARLQILMDEAVVEIR